MAFTAQQAKALALGSLPRGGYRPRGKRARQLTFCKAYPESDLDAPANC